MHDNLKRGTEKIDSLSRKICMWHHITLLYHSFLVGQSTGKSLVTRECIDLGGTCVIKHGHSWLFFVEFWEARGDLPGLLM